MNTFHYVGVEMPKVPGSTITACTWRHFQWKIGCAYCYKTTGKIVIQCISDNLDIPGLLHKFLGRPARPQALRDTQMRILMLICQIHPENYFDETGTSLKAGCFVSISRLVVCVFNLDILCCSLCVR